METPRRFLTIICTALALVSSAAVAGAATPNASIPATGSTMPKPPPLIDNPIIQSFNVSPVAVVQGDSITMSWNVSPGPGLSPITSVVITVEGATVFNGPTATSTTIRPFTWIGEKTFTLTARNNAGKTSTITRTVRGISLIEAMSKITIANMEANPQRFLPGQPIDFKVVINNGNPGFNIHPVNIFITQGTRVVGNKVNANLPPGAVMQSLQDSGFNAAGGYYIVDLEYRGQHKTRNFMAKPITMYTIDPTTP